MIIPTSHITINFYFYFCCVKCNRLILQKLIPRCLDMILVAFSLCPYFRLNSENASPRNDFMTFALFAERRCQQRRWTPPPTWAPCQAPIQPPPPPNHFFRSVFKSLFYQHGRVLLTQTTRPCTLCSKDNKPSNLCFMVGLTNTTFNSLSRLKF